MPYIDKEHILFLPSEFLKTISNDNNDNESIQHEVLTEFNLYWTWNSNTHQK